MGLVQGVLRWIQSKGIHHWPGIWNVQIDGFYRFGRDGSI